VLALHRDWICESEHYQLETVLVRRIDLGRARAARLDTIRDINRQIVLNYIRERGPISRADIARETELQRSTVSLIVEDLVIEGLVEELGIGESTGGRPPNLLRLRADGPMAVGVDITIPHTTVATCNLLGQVLQREQFPTDPSADETLRRVIRVVREFKRQSGDKVEGVGVVVPGQVDYATGMATYIPYFDWRDVEIAKKISAATGLRVSVDNDANAAALAELWLGRPDIGRVRDFLVVLVHEGVGTGMVFDGQVYRGRNSIAGEFGHMVLGGEAPVVCSCGKRHCWEAFSCVRAAVARYEVATPRRPRGIAPPRFPQLVELALNGDPVARKAIEETGRSLGVGLANLSVGMAPEAIVVTGSILLAWPLIARVVEQTVSESLSAGFGRPLIIASTLGDKETLMGALSLVLTEKFGVTATA
jgi:predicted NBD/HSP70 family sugar kinase